MEAQLRGRSVPCKVQGRPLQQEKCFPSPWARVRFVFPEGGEGSCCERTLLPQYSSDGGKQREPAGVCKGGGWASAGGDLDGESCLGPFGNACGGQAVSAPGTAAVFRTGTGYSSHRMLQPRGGPCCCGNQESNSGDYQMNCPALLP